MDERTIEIPEYWTAEQADAVLDFIYALEKAIFIAYERRLADLVLHQSDGDPDPVTNDDSIPF